jgi:hypothetical protein
MTVEVDSGTAKHANSTACLLRAASAASQNGRVQLTLYEIG